jgi:hypothetical protein
MRIMVEGKVSETFGEKVEVWIGENPSEGKRKRLEFESKRRGYLKHKISTTSPDNIGNK